MTKTTTPKTKVIREGTRWQARYYDTTMRLWFDLGDPRNTREEAAELARTWPWPDTHDHEMRPCGHPEDQCASPGCCLDCGERLAWDGRGGYGHALDGSPADA